VFKKGKRISAGPKNGTVEDHNTHTETTTDLRLNEPKDYKMFLQFDGYLATGNAFEDLKFANAVSPQFTGIIVLETCLLVGRGQ
jgi:hypothetical protein